MTKPRSIAAIRKVLAAGSLVFGLSAIALIAVPGIFNQLLGLQTTPDLEWAMRMIGITLVALAGNMYSVSANGTEKAVNFSGGLMLLSAAGLGVITLLIPTSYNLFTITYAAVGFGFSAAYAWALARK
jgi:uncharacterized membrane protein YccC